LVVSIAASFTNMAVCLPADFTTPIQGGATHNGWGFWGGRLETHPPHTSHSLGAPGEDQNSFFAFHKSYPGGVGATVTIRVANYIHYVAAGSANPVAPYTSWATAATNIQDAVDAAAEPGALVLVTNGIYSTGGRQAADYYYNRVVVDKPLKVR